MRYSANLQLPKNFSARIAAPQMGKVGDGSNISTAHRVWAQTSAQLTPFYI